MARSLGEIYAEYNKAINAANALDGIAADLDKQVGNVINDAINSVSGQWKSENCSVFVSKGASLKGKTTANSGELRAVAAAIRQAAAAIKKADIAAYNAAQQIK